MTVADEIRALLDQIKPGHMPGPAALRTYLETRSTKLTTAGPNLKPPAWAVGVAGGSDLFAELAEADDAMGIRMWPDTRGPGAFVELTLRHGTLAEVEAVTGPTDDMPRRYPALSSAFAMPTIHEFPVSIWIEHAAGQVKIVRIGFDDLSKPAR